MQELYSNCWSLKNVDAATDNNVLCITSLGTPFHADTGTGGGTPVDGVES